MKTSQNCKPSRVLAAGALGLAAFLAWPMIDAPQADTITQTQQYQPWAGASGQQLKSLITDLKAKIAAAEQSQAASPDFLDDLKALVTKYETLQTSGQTITATPTQIFADTFADGNFTANPTWKVSAGTWTVDTGGTNHGLVSKIRPQ